MYGQTTFVPDDNFEQALIDQGLDDILDNEVLTQNISGIEFFDIQNNSISDLTGLEDFESLTGILCDGNNFTSISFHPNVNLSFLVCQYNELTELDVSQHTNLIDLACTSNNLTSLDISSNVNLTVLIAGDNQFTELNLTNNPNIYQFDLNLQNPVLETLDLRNGNNTNIMYFGVATSPNLPYILVDDCAYSTQNWTNIDPNITFIESEGQTECVLSVIDHNLNLDVKIYPNPTKETLFIENFQNLKIQSIDLIDINGRAIVSITDDFNTITLENLELGLYILRIQTEFKSVFKKVIKI